MVSVDTLQIDSTQLAVFQNDTRYDYDRELVGGSQNFLEWLSSVIRDWFNETFNVLMDSDVVYYTLITLGCLLAVFLVWIVYKKKPGLFRQTEDESAMDYDVTADTIYGFDFDKEIRQALAQKDYRQAVRMLYLQCLKHLSDTGKIDWQPSKTPMQYMRQLGNADFSELSRLFIRVRYGNYLATEQLFLQMKELQQSIIVHDSDENGAQPTMNNELSTMNNEKGGEP